MAGKRIVVRKVKGKKRGEVIYRPLITPWTVGSKHLMLASLEIEPGGNCLGTTMEDQRL